MRLTLILISLFATLLTQAQITPGAKLGINFARYRLQSEESPYATRLGINTGIVARMPVGKKFFIQSDLLYTQKGHTYKDESIIQGTNKLNYVALDILGGYKITNEFHLLFGPEVGRLVKQEYNTGNGTFEPDENYGDWDLGIDLGFSYFINRNVGLETRYSHGFLKTYEVIITDQFGNQIGSTKVGMNRVFQLNVMYFFARRSK